MGKEVGYLLREGRLIKGYSQGELARKLGFEQAQSISNIERGVSPLPHKLIPRLCGELEIEVEGLIETILHEQCCKIYGEISEELAKEQRRKYRFNREKWHL